MYQPTIDATAWTLLAPSKPLRGSHIIVLTYAQSGAERLAALLTGQPSLACTAGTGVLPLCEQAATAWRGAERTGSSLSTLAAASVRAMTGGLISVIKSQEGRERWCEISTAPARSARTFMAIYPETKVVCFHRNCADYIYESVQGDRGELAGTVATAASHWQTRTESLLAFEADHAGQCLRVRYEDLVAGPATTAGLLAFLGLERPAVATRLPVGVGVVGAGGGVGAGDGAVLAGRLDAPLLAKVNGLHAELRYPVIDPVPGW
jgi:hypothetical protein